MIRYRRCITFPKFPLLWKSSGKNTKNTSTFDAPKNTRSSVKLTVYQFKLFQSQKKLWKSSGKNTKNTSNYYSPEKTL